MKTDNWLSLTWFDPSTIGQFGWESPFYFYFLLLVPLLFLLRALAAWRLKQKLPIALTRQQLRSGLLSLLRFVPDVVMALVLSLLLVALARPQITNEMVEQWTEGIDIMLAIDISESMQGQDFQPNRLEAARAVARDFIAGRFQDRIGIVIFSGEAYSLSPLTTDYELLYSLINDIEFGKIEKGGTAIGSALAVATNRMRESTAQTKVVILLSDGDNTAGNIDPIMAAQLAHAFDITIYTIAVGKEGRVPYGQNMFGQTVYMENTIDETNLRDIARIGQGQFYRATDNKALENIFDLIDEYEKAEIRETRYRDTIDYYVVYLKWAVMLFLLWILLKSTFMGNVLRD
jgi:Ca-activated chloride channel homolog